MSTAPKATPGVAAEAPDAQSAVSLSRGRVLLVEDNEVNQRVARLMLRALGYREFLVRNGEAAIEAVARDRFDVVLMDVQMPVLGGFDATRRIRDLEASSAAPQSPHGHLAGRRLPIIAMTARAMKGDRELCLDAGMDDYVSKPINMNELSVALDRALSSQPPVADPVPAAEPTPPAPVRT